MVPTRDGYKEMKVATTYDTPAVKDALANSLHYMAMFAKEFGEHLWVTLSRCGIYDADESIWACDGAKWKLKQYHDPEGEEIVDLIHASEHLSELAIEMHDQDTDEACIECMRTALRESGGAAVLDALRDLTGKGYKEKLREVIMYYENNVDRMDYPSYEAEGYHITSSTTESACRLWWVRGLKGVGCDGQMREHSM